LTEISLDHLDRQLQLVLSELRALREQLQTPAPKPAPTHCTIDHFCREMLGLKSKVSYYNHVNDPGWPQRVYPTGKPLLVLAECEAFVKTLDATRRAPFRFKKPAPPPAPPAAPPPAARKRHPGRPAKLHARA
jgi:hypothetical protein